MVNGQNMKVKGQPIYGKRLEYEGKMLVSRDLLFSGWERFIV